MYYKAFSEIGGSLCCAVSSGDGSKRKGSWKVLFDCAKRCSQHKGDAKKGWHKGTRLDVRGKSASGPGACRDHVDSQLSNAGKGQHLKRELRSRTGTTSSWEIQRSSAVKGRQKAPEIKKDLMTQDRRVVNKMGDRLAVGV